MSNTTDPLDDEESTPPKRIESSDQWAVFDIESAPLPEETLTDRDFLCWIHERLEHVHGESSFVDYMHKLRAIIADTPHDRETPNTGQGKNSLKELRKSWTTQTDQP